MLLKSIFPDFIMMSRHDKLAALFHTLKEMTLFEEIDLAFVPSRRLQRIENWLIGTCVLTVFILVCFAGWYRYGVGAPVKTMMQITSGILVGITALYMLTVGYGLYQVVRQRRKGRFAMILARLESELHSDAEFFAKLKSFDKPTLEYGLLQYRHRWSIFDGRVSLLAGDIRKLGIFPAWAAAAVSATILAKADSNFFLWAPLILACCFYFLAFYAIGQRERPEQVIALLELAIRQADEKNAAALGGGAASESGTTPQGTPASLGQSS